MIMYGKVLVPLDGSTESEMVLNSIEDLVDPEGEVVLLKVIPPMQGQTIGQVTVTASQREEAEEANARAYLRGVVRNVGKEEANWRCEAVVSRSVAEGITGFATRENVNLIAMYTHDRKGLARLIKGSIASQVQRQSPIEVRVFRPRELVEASA
jgi:nucleotide-binding universal stress UspA family protein